MGQRLKNKPHTGRMLASAAGATRLSSGSGLDTKERQRLRWLIAAICIGLSVTVWAVFGETIRYQFVNYDDPNYVSDNPIVSAGLSAHGIAWAFTHRLGPNWHPLTVLSHMLDCQLYGLTPGGHHLTNVLLHAAASVFLFLALREMTGALSRSAFVAAVFALHPLRVESVSWVAERKDVLSGFFFMLTLWIYAQYVRGNSSRQADRMDHSRSPFTSGFYWLTIVCYALALMSKPMVVTVPFVLLLLDYWPLRRFPMENVPGPGIGRLVLEKVPMLLMSVMDCAITLMTQEEGKAIRSVESLDFSTRLGNAALAYVAYLQQMVYPSGLAVYYPHPGKDLSFWKAGASLLLLLIITAGAFAWRRKRPWLLVGWSWYVGMLLPVIGLIQVGDQARADRYTYLPQIGCYILLTWGATDLCGAWRYRRIGLAFGAVLILTVLSAAAHAQAASWKDSVSLWSQCVRLTSRNYVAHLNLGAALLIQDQVDPAIEQFELALQLRPNYADAHIDLALALVEEGRLSQAIEHYQQALQLEPNSPKAHLNLGNALVRQGKLDTAIRHFKKALELRPDYAKGEFNLGNALNLQGDLKAAIIHFQQALALATTQKDQALAEISRTRLEACESALPH